MVTIHDPQTAPARGTRLQGPRRWRWTAKQFYKLADRGCFGDHKVELIDGELYELTRNPPHDTAVCLTRLALAAAFGPGYAVRDQKTLDLGRRNQPEPDTAVVRGDPRDFTTKHPTTAVLLVEVADSSLRYDRMIKGHRYALAGIADYWIVNLVDRQLEVYRNPGPDPARPGRFRYRDVTIVAADGHASPLANPGQQVAVADLLP
ncbi:MAG TPA: Uma2 family endonuclease [Isosphaeraceae bacterium]|nr:Uma2 family endonuclease [Isosphaeraceae bacterium]